jgi:hypothetical protein
VSATRYTLDFGDTNTGYSPTFDYFVRLDTGAAVTPPTVHEAAWGHGSYYFDWDWALVAGYDTIAFQITVNGLALSDVISGVLGPGSSTATGGATSLLGYDTAKNIINRAALQVGIAQGTLASLPDPFASASTDGNYALLIELLNTLGDELNNKHDWTQFVKECTITTAGSATSYALPADFHEMRDQTGWNRSMRLPLVGPLSGQETQFLKSRLGNVIINVAFRLDGNLMVFPIAPANGQTIVFEYISSYWVQTAASTTGPDLGTVTSATDTVIYDPALMVAGLKLSFLESKGFDTAKAEQRFKEQLAHCIGKNVGARILSLGGTGLNADRFLDTGNIPPMGFG